MILLGKRKIEPTLPDEIPELDEEQLAAAEWMAQSRHGGNAALFSDPGAGKTLTALKAVDLLSGDSLPRVVVVCPTIAIRTWAVWSYKTALDWADSEPVIQIIRGNKDEVFDIADVVIVTYGTIGRRTSTMRDQLIAGRFDILICDESDNLVGHDSNRTQAILGDYGLAKSVDHAFFLTGTPIPRYADGLWPLLSTCFPRRLWQYKVDTKEKFMDKFVVERLVKYGNMRFPKRTVVNSKNEKLLNELLYRGHDKVAVRNKLKIRSVPKHHDLNIDLKPSVELRQLIREVEQTDPMEVNEFGEPVRQVNSKTATMLKVYGTELAPPLVDAVTDLLHDSRPILFLFWHKDVGKLLQSNLIDKGWSTARIDGSTDSRARDRIVDHFNAGELDALCGQIKAMGVALNLQERCHNVVFAEETYSNAMNLQAYQRVWRRGQKKDVNIYWCRTLLGVSDMRINVADRKAEKAHEILD